MSKTYQWSIDQDVPTGQLLVRLGASPAVGLSPDLAEQLAAQLVNQAKEVRRRHGVHLVKVAAAACGGRVVQGQVTVGTNSPVTLGPGDTPGQVPPD